jgi:uncharacterized OB-fold protein
MDAYYCGECGRWIIVEQDHFDVCTYKNRGVEVVSGYVDLYSSNKGWECPKCGSVWSPTTVGCTKCNSSSREVTCDCNNERNIQEEE